MCVHHQITGFEGDGPADGSTGFCVLRQLLEKVMALLVCFQRAGGRGWSGEILLGAQGCSAYIKLSQQHHCSLLEMLNYSSSLLCDCFMCFSQQNQSRIDNL